jgi:glycosyltransferase involved in cell wall biosynthesis
MRKEERRLKILFLPAWYPSEENRVAGVFVREHAQAVALYNDVTVVYNEGVGKHLNGLYKIVSDKTEDGIRTIRIRHKKFPIPKTSYFICLWSIFKAFRKLMREGWRPDITHAHVYSAGVPAVILGKIYKIPVVITEHWSGFSRRILRTFDILRARFAMNRAKILLPVSQNLKEAIESYGIKNRFQLIPNVINTEMFHPSTSQYRNEKKRILLVALLSPIKGIPYLLRALAQLKEKRQDFVLDIVGDGPNRQEYEELTNKLELGEMVRFHGLKSKPEVAEYMRQCDFFVLPSLWENLPCVLIEAMASGIPVIATDVGGVKEMINESVGLLIPPKKTKTLEEAIEYMLDDSTNYSPEKIAKYAKEKFSYATVSRQLDAIYREVLVK